MALDFYFVDENLCDPYILTFIYEVDEWFLGNREEGIEIEESGRLSPLWDFFQEKGVHADYFHSFYIPYELIEEACAKIKNLWGEISQTKPFYSYGDPSDPYKRMCDLLTRASDAKSCLIAICD